MATSTFKVAYDRVEAEITKIEKAITGYPASSSAEDIKAKLNELAAQRKAVGQLWLGPTGADPSLADKNALKSRIARAESQMSGYLYGLPVHHDNRKLFYSEHGQWARHFSTVRMAVMTLTITTCTGIIAWRWTSSAPNPESLLYPVAGLWMTGSITFWMFTYYTYKQVRSQSNLRDWMPDGIPHKSEHKDGVKFDSASLVVPLFSLGILCLALEKHVITENWQSAVGLGFIVAGLAAPCVTVARLNETCKWIIASIVLVLLAGAITVAEWEGSWPVPKPATADSGTNSVTMLRINADTVLIQTNNQPPSP